MEDQNQIKQIFDTFLGSPRRDQAGSGGWYEYNCPSCTEENCGVPDNKYNLAVNFEIGDEHGMFMHCWCCGFAGTLSKLAIRYGTPEIYNKYKTIVKDYKNAHLYEIQNGELVIGDDIIERNKIKLPSDTSTVYDGTDDGKRALDYLYSRGVDDFLIKKHRLKYVGNKWGNPFRNMIIIPSYDGFGELNYYSGRDFSGKDKYNKKNADIPKTSIVFNEELINWYEPITLCEGPFDHIVVPNSLPLLGKTIDETYLLYKTLITKAKHIVNIMLDNDAIDTAYKNYVLLNNSNLRGRVRLIFCPKGYDPSDVYKDFGKRGILQLLASAQIPDDYLTTIITTKRQSKWKRN